MDDLFNKLQLIPDLTLKLDSDLTTFTTFRLPSRGNLLEVRSVTSLQKVLPLLVEYQMDYLVVGWGANQILPVVCNKLIIHLDLPFSHEYLESPHDEYQLPASLGLNYLTSHAVKFGLKGWEVFTGIPASLGGAIYMNAGTNLGEIGSLVKEVELVTREGELRLIQISVESFSYRTNNFVNDGDIIVGATLFHRGLDLEISKKIKKYLEFRKCSQPLATRNCGCVFKNPRSELQAGRLIDLMGLKRLKVGGLKVSTKHANFIENHGGSTWEDFKILVGIIKSNMDHFYGIEFELEVKIPYD